MTGTIASLLGGLMGEGEGRGVRENTMTLAEILAALQDKARRMAEPNPFRVGDLVTVRRDADVKGCGEPHVVVDLLERPIVDDKAESGSNQFLRRYDMRVAHFQGDRLTVHAIDHSVLEPWTEAHAAVWLGRRDAGRAERPDSVSPHTPLTEIVRRLRAAGQRVTSAKIVWKQGDLVEIVGHKASNAAEPMLFGGRAIGFVELVDRSDDTTRVIYFDSDGDQRQQWFKPSDLQPYRSVGPVADEAG
jgi:hypothetical protein